jgi:hypothetical protein
VDTRRIGENLGRRGIERLMAGSGGRFLRNADRRATVPEIRKIGDVALVRYALSLRLLDA